MWGLATLSVKRWQATAGKDLPCSQKSRQGNVRRGIVVCIEAKVDETFGKEIKDTYAAAKKKGGNSNAPKRIKNLIENFHLGKDSDEIRYQLVHYLAGSISEAKQYGDIVFMPIIVYHTSKFNAKKGKKNKEDYEHFHKSLNFLKVPNTNIYEKEFDGTQVYITYLEIDGQKGN
ncbi:MAG: hypothetical protein KBS75_04125 [Bacteroidales bacterium]|nr:hypothetical protein [Candidatus Equimonas faecalis]